MAARGLVNGRGPRSGRDLVFRCYPHELLSPPPKKKTEADLLGQPLYKCGVEIRNLCSNLLEPLHHTEHNAHRDEANYSEYCPALPDWP